jgi:hypothetical protein
MCDAAEVMHRTTTAAAAAAAAKKYDMAMRRCGCVGAAHA